MGVLVYLVGHFVAVYIGVSFAYRRKCVTCGHRHWSHVDEWGGGDAYCLRCPCFNFVPKKKGE